MLAALTSGAAAQQPERCPNQHAIDRASGTASDNAAVTDPACKPPKDAKEYIEQALKTFGAQSAIATAATTGFTGALLSRLDSVNGQAAAGIVITQGADGLMGLGMGRKTRPQQPGPVTPASPLTVYAMGTFGGGHRSDLPDMVGFNYEATSGTVGLEYRINRNLIVGLAGNHTTAAADLSNSGTVDVEAVQVAAYLSYATKLWFIDALMGYGRHDLDMVRPGNGINLLRSSPDGDVFAASIRAGYLFEIGGIRAGPIAGLTFVRSHLEGYTESGDPQQALTVGSQRIDATTASAGVRFLAPFVTGGKVVIPYLNVTLEHQMGERGRSISAGFALQPQAPVFSAVPNFDTRTYGKVEGGVTFQLGPNVSATIGAASTFARDEGNDYRVSTGINYRF